MKKSYMTSALVSGLFLFIVFQGVDCGAEEASDAGYGPRFQREGMGPGEMEPSAGGSRQGLHQRRGFRGKRGPGGGRQTFEHLNLTTEQRKSVFELRKENRKKMYYIRSRMWDLRFELSNLLADKKFNEKELSRVADKLAKNKREDLGQRIEFVKKVRKILTPEQIEKLNLGIFSGEEMR